MKLVALKKLSYPCGPDCREYKVGDSFESVSDSDAKLLMLVGVAKEFEQVIENQPAYKTAALEPEQNDAPDLLSGRNGGGDASKPRRTYRRRDMKAEDQST